MCRDLGRVTVTTYDCPWLKKLAQLNDVSISFFSLFSFSHYLLPKFFTLHSPFPCGSRTSSSHLLSDGSSQVCFLTLVSAFPVCLTFLSVGWDFCVLLQAPSLPLSLTAPHSSLYTPDL